MQSELSDSPGLVLCRQAICLLDGQMKVFWEKFF